MSAPLSIPRRVGAPRALDEQEYASLTAIADVLIPAHADIPAASTEPGFADRLRTALDARSDAFEAIAQALRELAAVPQHELFDRLEQLAGADPDTFQALSAVIAGAWLLTPGVRDRIGYHGLLADRAGLEDAANELTGGLLDPVLERADAGPGRWIR